MTAEFSGSDKMALGANRLVSEALHKDRNGAFPMQTAIRRGQDIRYLKSAESNPRAMVAAPRLRRRRNYCRMIAPDM
jgi:hypothetical protein